MIVGPKRRVARFMHYFIGMTASRRNPAVRAAECLGALTLVVAVAPGLNRRRWAQRPAAPSRSEIHAHRGGHRLQTGKRPGFSEEFPPPPTATVTPPRQRVRGLEVRPRSSPRTASRLPSTDGPPSETATTTCTGEVRSFTARAMRAWPPRVPRHPGRWPCGRRRSSRGRAHRDPIAQVRELARLTAPGSTLEDQTSDRPRLRTGTARYANGFMDVARPARASSGSQPWLIQSFWPAKPRTSAKASAYRASRRGPLTLGAPPREPRQLAPGQGPTNYLLAASGRSRTELIRQGPQTAGRSFFPFTIDKRRRCARAGRRPGSRGVISGRPDCCVRGGPAWPPAGPHADGKVRPPPRLRVVPWASLRLPGRRCSSPQGAAAGRA